VALSETSSALSRPSSPTCILRYVSPAAWDRALRPTAGAAAAAADKRSCGRRARARRAALRCGWAGGRGLGGAREGSSGADTRGVDELGCPTAPSTAGAASGRTLSGGGKRRDQQLQRRRGRYLLGIWRGPVSRRCRNRCRAGRAWRDLRRPGGRTRGELGFLATFFCRRRQGLLEMPALLVDLPWTSPLSSSRIVR